MADGSSSGAGAARGSWLWNPRAASRCRWAVRAAGVAAVLVLAAGFAWPDDLAREEAWFVRVSWAAFMVRTFGFHIGLGLAGLALVALLLRAQRSGAALAATSLVVLWPALAGLAARRVDAGGRPTLTVMSVNLLFGGADAAALAREIERVSPDVVVFQEYTGASAERLHAALGSRFEHRFEQPRDDAFGQAVYSRLPFSAAARAFPPGDARGAWRDPQVRVAVEFEGRAVAIMDVHLVPPTSLAWVMQQRRDAMKLAALAAREIAGLSAEGGFIIAGDFNATPQSPHLGAMRRAGLREARSGRETSWPRTMPLKLAPGVKIDHVLYAGGLECVGSGVCGDIGSDHRPVWGRFVRGEPVGPAGKKR